MKKVLLALSVAVSLLIGGGENDLAVAETKKDNCQIGDRALAIASLTADGSEVFVARGAAVEKIVTFINKNRAKAGVHLFEADEIIAGMKKVNGTLYVAMAWIKNDCVVPGTVEIMTFEDFVRASAIIGVDLKDFQQEKGA